MRTLKLKENVQILLYIGRSSCGDARYFSPCKPIRKKNLTDRQINHNEKVV